MKHTPGPWDVLIFYRRAYDGSGFPAFQINEAIHAVDKESKANAKLIAAAPEMLEALEYAYENIAIESENSGKILKKIRAAIKKSKGEA